MLSLVLLTLSSLTHTQFFSEISDNFAYDDDFLKSGFIEIFKYKNQNLEIRYSSFVAFVISIVLALVICNLLKNYIYQFANISMFRSKSALSDVTEIYIPNSKV